MRQSDLFGGVDAYGAPIAAPTGEELRDKAIARALDNAPPDWVQSVWDALDVITRKGPWQFTTDQVWNLCNCKPPEPRALGGLMREAAAKGMIRKTDRVVPSSRPECHRRPVAVWEVCA